MTTWKNVIKATQNKNNSGRMRRERTQENFNLIQEKHIKDPRVLATQNGFDITSKKTFNRIIIIIIFEA